MTTKYPEHVSQILNKWFQEISQLADSGKINLETIRQVEHLLTNDEMANASKIKAALEKGYKR